jgi:hypothetical protein
MANDVGRRIFFLAKGLVKIFNLSPHGVQTIFWFCVPDDVFGVGAISGSPYQSYWPDRVFSPIAGHRVSCPAPE